MTLASTARAGIAPHAMKRTLVPALVAAGFLLAPFLFRQNTSAQKNARAAHPYASDKPVAEPRKLPRLTGRRGASIKMRLFCL